MQNYLTFLRHAILPSVVCFAMSLSENHETCSYISGSESASEPIRRCLFIVKTLYNVIHYNRIFNIQHKFVGNGSVSIKIPAYNTIFT